ncbi:UNVERIFIED_CONTAM: hypothetical protein Sradi_0697000 [Sesamum radiatum]|uniref:Uncharacterized protein n=1 Tax=Sesamum radiatum TaxID=300843 RepID=A0AAW2VRM9_SESRA
MEESRTEPPKKEVKSLAPGRPKNTDPAHKGMICMIARGLVRGNPHKARKAHIRKFSELASEV